MQIAVMFICLAYLMVTGAKVTLDKAFCSQNFAEAFPNLD